MFLIKDIDIDTDIDLTLDVEEKVGSEDTTDAADMSMAEKEDAGEDTIDFIKIVDDFTIIKLIYFYKNIFEIYIFFLAIQYFFSYIIIFNLF